MQKLAKVSGRGEFPIDMLRRDSCSPATETDSMLISQTFKQYGYWEIYVKVRPLSNAKSHNPWTNDRWTSFGVRFEPITESCPPGNRSTMIDDRPARERVLS